MTTWNPDEYLRYGDERSRPSVDLVSRIAIDSPATVIDLGCGPGNSTAVLRQRWPVARVVGVDSSPEMIGTASAANPGQEWIVGSIEEWDPAEPFDVVFSNAALQWLPDHGPLVERLFEHLADGGALAFQIPSIEYALVGDLIREVALEGPWAPQMAKPLGMLTMEHPAFYYDHLAPRARSVDLWETEYVHVMESPSAIVDWISSTGMRPFLEALDSDEDRREFTARLGDRVRESYPVRGHGKVLFPFRRLFVVAYA
jgi:trans-aconitate 2-methyltransferase